ncbi:MAG: polyphosphate kinase 2 family protein [Bacteroidetes bacterium]|nr:polyphosphate kinase 2 family protein [Bacteroidota bacterium]
MFEEYKIGSKLEKLDVRAFDSHVAMSTHECEDILSKNKKTLNKLQEKLYGQSRQSLLIVFQAMDAAGKDSTIRAVFSGMNPQGFLVSSFKKPSSNELAHDFLWRVNRQLPSRGRIGIFNRSHYEEVLVCKVHPEYVTYQNLPGIHSVQDITPEFWTTRFRQINDYERYLAETGTRIIKFFLNVSREEQEARFLRRMEKPEKYWKFSLGDLGERALWEDYMDAYSEAIRETSSENAPWYVIPADDKDYMRAVVSDIVTHTMKDMDLSYPEITERQVQDIARAKEILNEEKLKS